MSIIKMNTDKSLVITVSTDNYQFEHLAEDLSFLIPKNYNGINLEDCTILLNLIGVTYDLKEHEHNVSVADVILLSDPQNYNDEYFSCKIAMTKDFTFKPLNYKLWLTFLNSKQELVLKTGSCHTKVSPTDLIEEYMSECQLSLIDDWEIKMEQAYSKVLEMSLEIEKNTNITTDNVKKSEDILSDVQSEANEFKEFSEKKTNDIQGLFDNSMSEIESKKTDIESSINALADSIKADITKGDTDIDNKIADGISAINSAKENAITALNSEIENFKKCDWIYTIINNNVISSVVDIFNNLTVPKTINGIDSSTLLWNVDMTKLCCNQVDLSNIRAYRTWMRGNKFIKRITFGDVRGYGDQGFARGSEVEYVVFNNTNPVPELPAYAFFNCSKLKKIVLGEGITSCFHCFTGCTSLTDVTFPSTMKEISYYSFWGCSSLETITIPSSVETIHSTAFGGDCSKLKTITVNKPADSIPGAPWGAANATVIWKGDE